MDDVLTQARDALRGRQWAEAYELLERADGQQPFVGPDELELLGQAAYLSGNPEPATHAFERLHGVLVAAGASTPAAAIAHLIAFIQYDALMLAPSRAWLRRAERLIEHEPESSVHAGTKTLRAWHAMTSGDYETSLRLAREAIAIADRVGDRDSAAIARVAEGRTLIASGELEAGMELLDESALAAASGELQPIPTGVVFCQAACAYQSVSDYERADEWTRAMEEWSSSTEMVAFQGRCRVHRAQLRRLHGSWREAASDALRAADELARASPPERGWALTELGQVRLRMGDLDRAEAAFSEAHAVGWNPQPGQALLLLAREQVDAARSTIRDALEVTDPSRSREVPPVGPLRRAPLLAAAVEIGVAAGDLDEAASAARELEATAATYGTAALRATAADARGAVQLAEGEPAAAQRSFATALALWQELDAPYEAARTRMRVAAGARAAGNEERATREYAAAHAAFQRLEAALDARIAASKAVSAIGSAPSIRRVMRTFMFTDMVGSTNLVEAIGDEAWRHLVRWHADTLERLIAANGGTVVKGTGDGYFAAFEGAADGIRAAVAIQRALAEHRRETGFAPRVRSGLHAAEADTDGTDWTGMGVHAAARVGAVAQGDEVLATRATAESAGSGFKLTEARSVALKGISTPVDVVTVDWR